MKTYYVYMLRCIDGTFYTGFTSDIEQRYAQHCAGEYKTCYTFMRRPLIPVYVGEFQTPDEAIAFEKRLKKWSHKKKRAFAERDWPLLKLLANPRAGARISDDDWGCPSTTRPAGALLGMTSLRPSSCSVSRELVRRTGEVVVGLAQQAS